MGISRKLLGSLAGKWSQTLDGVSRLPAETFSWSVNVSFFREPFLILRKVATCKTRLMPFRLEAEGLGDMVDRSLAGEGQTLALK